MREQLIQYVDLLFAGTRNCEDMKQEILQNTLDRYDDLIREGRVPEAAYRLAISGIGDIHELLGTTPVSTHAYSQTADQDRTEDIEKQKKLRATAIALYILCPIPLFLMSELGASIVGLCGLLFMVAVATALIIMSSKNQKEAEAQEAPVSTPQQRLRKTVKTVINVAGLVIYLLLSFSTSAWYVTWLIFPIMAALWALINAIWDLKEATKHEN